MSAYRCIETVQAAQWSSVTHLMSDKPSGKKYAMCQAKGIPCVSTHWIASCMATGRLVGPEAFALKPSSASSGDVTKAVSTTGGVDATQAAKRPQFVSQGQLSPQAILELAVCAHRCRRLVLA